MISVTGFETPLTFSVETVSELKAAIENSTFVPAEFLQLTCNGALLTSLSGDEEVECTMAVDAGMRAKWRKKRMRRLRRKRRKMRQRAR
ncbi:hypothetical protein TL16_g00025 [Triparma laevis f. inornata]|uniref:60S ribosomal protein L41 n=2 Tax=Triparma laevis TaxID=1534972 RepID=A0A9W7CJY3_9STRA|nr:hypothetical protein TL16_g00025 [Triparma laevis f. inornata]GMI07852.1 hypothetical protein TrLO_g11590 [Triparma laevis f. longispina]